MNRYRLAEHLQKRREELGLTKSQVARRLRGKGRPPLPADEKSVYKRYDQWENAQRGSGLEYLVELAEVLDTTPAWLLGIDDEAAPDDLRGQIGALMSELRAVQEELADIRQTRSARTTKTPAISRGSSAARLSPRVDGQPRRRS